MKWTIEQVGNGFIITYPDFNTGKPEKELVEFDPDIGGPHSNEDCTAARDLIYRIIYCLNLGGYYFDIKCHGKHDYKSKE